MIGPDAPLWLPLLLSILGGTFLGAAITALVNWRLGVRGHEREARKDERDAGDRLTGRVLDWAKQLEARVAELEKQRRDDEHRLRIRGDHIAALEHHIWQGNPPPPPARPSGL